MRQSWDGFANEGGYVMHTKNESYPNPVRVVPWGECPYPQEQVPQVNEEAGNRIILTTPHPRKRT